MKTNVINSIITNTINTNDVKTAKRILKTKAVKKYVKKSMYREFLQVQAIATKGNSVQSYMYANAVETRLNEDVVSLRERALRIFLNQILKGNKLNSNILHYEEAKLIINNMEITEIVACFDNTGISAKKLATYVIKFANQSAEVKERAKKNMQAWKMSK